MKLRLRYFVGAAVVALGAWIALYPDDWRNWLGFSKAAYFQNGQNYAFFSGVGPIIVTLTVSGGIFATLVHRLNCHQEGCPRIGRYPVGDSGWKTCRRHHPDPKVREGLRAHHLHAAWKSHQERTGQQ